MRPCNTTCSVPLLTTRTAGLPHLAPGRTAHLTGCCQGSQAPLLWLFSLVSACGQDSYLLAPHPGFRALV